MLWGYYSYGYTDTRSMPVSQKMCLSYEINILVRLTGVAGQKNMITRKGAVGSEIEATHYICKV
jgi:hypothetical protein